MAISGQQIKDFWFDFDNMSRYGEPAPGDPPPPPPPDAEVDPQLQAAYGRIRLFTPREPIDIFRSTRAAGTYPKQFIAEMVGAKTSHDYIAYRQEQVMDKYFHGYSADDDMTEACWQFGQGLLTDMRRNTQHFGFNVIHSMDTGGSPPIGYHRWHGCIRAYTLINGITDGKWLSIDRNIALAWAVQSLLKPVGSTSSGSNPNTKSIDSGDLDALKAKYLNMSFDELDDAFDHAPYPDS